MQRMTARQTFEQIFKHNVCETFFFNLANYDSLISVSLES